MIEERVELKKNYRIIDLGSRKDLTDVEEVRS